MNRRLLLLPLVLLCACCGRTAPPPAPVVLGAHWAGATTSDMDLLIGRLLEATVIGIPGVTGTRSLSVDSHHALWVDFDGNDVEAKMRILDALAATRFPADSEPPWMTTGGAATRPRLWIVVSGDSTGPSMAPAANDLARDLLGVVGVDRADVRGGAQPRVAIRVDPSRAAAYGATVHDILEAVHAATSMGTAEALAATPVGGRAAQIVLLADVATVEHGFGPRDTLVSSSGDGVVLVEVMAAQGVDRVAFEEAVTATVERAAPTFPASVDVIDPDDADLVVDVIGPVEGEPLVRIAAHLSELADELGADWVVGQVGAPHHPDLPRAIDDRTARLHLGWPEGPPERTRERLTDACGGHPGFSCWVRSPSSEMATLLVTADEDTGLEVAADVEAAAAVVSGVLSTHHVAPPRERTVSVLPDRDRLARLGLDSSDVTRTVRAATLGLPAGQLIDGDRLIPVVVNWGEIERSDLQALAALELLGSRQEAPIPLGEVCAIEIDAAPRSIHRVNGLWASTVLVELPSRGHGRVRKGVEAAVREVVLPGGTAVTFE